MKVLLINSDFCGINDQETMPLAMYALGSVIRNKGHNIRILDPGLYRRGYFKEDIDQLIIDLSIQYDVIAFSVNTFTWPRAMLQIKNLRKNSYKGYIIAGGVHPTRVPEYVMKKADIDYVLLGEGEESFPILLDALENKCKLAEVPNLVYRNDEEILFTKRKSYIHLDNKIPLPAYDLVPTNAYKQWSIESSRGCIGNCSFCSIIYKRCWRGYNAEDVLQRMYAAEKEIANKNLPANIDFTDDYFFPDKDRAIKILNEMANSQFKKYRFIVESRIRDTYNQDYIHVFKKLCGMSVQYGVECGYDEGLIRIKKGILKKDIFEAANILYRNSLNTRVFFSFIIGFPWENKQQIYETLETAIRIRIDYQIHVNIAWWIPLPSEEFDYLRKIKPEIGYDIFDKIDWHRDVDLFMRTHPNLTEPDRDELNAIMNRLKEFGYTLRL